MKVCPKCKTSKELSLFNSQQKYCKLCHNAISRIWRLNNPSKNRKSQEEYLIKRHISQKESCCCKCKQIKSHTEFHIRNKKLGILSARCKICSRRYAKEYIEKKSRANKERIIQYLQKHPCVDCGQTDIIVLDFDHRSNKVSEIGKLLRINASWDIIEREIQKCDIRCSNCHRRKTAKECASYKWKFLNGTWY